jgi:hypothetical protein
MHWSDFPLHAARVWILMVAWLSHLSWFACIHYDQSWQLILLAIIAFCAGNVWYVFHRYTVHQLIDRLAYWRTKARLRGYRKWLIEHVAKSFRLREERPELYRPLEMRAARIIFMFIVCETVFIAACWHEQCFWFVKIGAPNSLCQIRCYGPFLVLGRHLAILRFVRR